MGVYTLVTLTLECDNCSRMIGKLITSKGDVPVYARADMYCADCIAQNLVGDLSTTTTKDVLDYINTEANLKAGSKEKT